jgi:hypothetical protein
MGYGARIICAYVTNGESGEPDDADRPPAEVAVMLRESATAALRKIEATALFWNLPDIAAAPSREYVLIRWDADTLTTRVRTLVLQFRPDMILLHDDAEATEGTFLVAVLERTVMEVCAALRRRSRGGTPALLPEEMGWDVGRIWLEQPDGVGVKARTAANHPVSARAYALLAEEAAQEYGSFMMQRASRAQRSPGGGYRALHPVARRKVLSLLSGVPGPPPLPLRALGRTIKEFAGHIEKAPVRSRYALRTAAKLIDSVDQRIGRAGGSASRERRILLDWKENLEELRANLLGVTVHFRITETTLTERQITYLHIDSVAGPLNTGKTEIYLPGVAQGWVLNEQMTPRLPLQYAEPYRIISPVTVAYDLPATREFGNRATVFQPLILYIIHKGGSREQNFFKRVDIPLRFAPRFATEVLTPIVRCLPGEEVRVRLTNNSRDGVADALRVADSLAGNASAGFRLSAKGSVAELALPLECSIVFPGGEAVIPLEIGAYRVGQFLVRQFDVLGNAGRAIGVISGRSPAEAEHAVRRTGLGPVLRLDSLALARDVPDSVDVVLLDRRAYLLLPWLRAKGEQLRRFVSRGGHLVILAQDEAAWPSGFPLQRFGRPEQAPLPPEAPIVWDTSHAFVRGPNDLRGSIILQPVFRAAWHRLNPGSEAELEVVARCPEGRPLLVSAREGAGRVTYAGVELVPQWMSVQPGALRLLANILSN